MVLYIIFLNLRDKAVCIAGINSVIEWLLSFILNEPNESKLLIDSNNRIQNHINIDNIIDLFVIPGINSVIEWLLSFILNELNESKLLIVSNSRIQNYIAIDGIIDLFVVFTIYIYAYLFYYIIMLTLQITVLFQYNIASYSLQ